MFWMHSAKLRGAGEQVQVNVGVRCESRPILWVMDVWDNWAQLSEVNPV